MKNKDKRLKSGFPIFDLLTGGYPTGTFTVIRTLGGDLGKESLQRFIERQTLRLALPEPRGMGRTVLFLSLGMDSETAAKGLSIECTSLGNPGDIFRAGIMISSLEKEGKPREEIQSELVRAVREHAGRADCVVIDDIGRAVDGDASGSRYLQEQLSVEAARLGVAILVTDYDNAWDTTWDPGHGYDGYMKIEIVSDVHDKTQADVRFGKSRVTIDDVFDDCGNAGIEMVRIMMERRRDGEVRVNDEIDALALSAAVLVEQLNQKIKGK